MKDETYKAIMAKLDEAQDILLKGFPADPPDMEVSEWNQTPIGRAVGVIGDAKELLEDSE